MTRRDDISPGSLRRQTKLGTVATYSVVEITGDTVEVEVVAAPGLQPGTRLRLTLAAVSAMESVDAADG